MTKERDHHVELPKPLEVNFATIPEELKQQHAFVVWQYRFIDGDIKKPPYDPRSWRLASVANPTTWGSFQEAKQAYETGRFAGIGLMLDQHTRLVGVDIDHCITKNGITSQAQNIITTLNTYTEISPSGEGIRCFLKGSLPGVYRRKNNIELYSEKRYLTLTGHTIQPFATIPERQEALNKVYDTLFQTDSPPPPVNTGRGGEPASRLRRNALADEAVLEKAFKAKNAEKFKRFYEGDASVWQQTPHSSQSSADFTLCLMLLFWCNDDVLQVDRLFRRSGLYRPKWDRKTGALTYGELTIRNALLKRQIKKGSAGEGS